MSNPIFIFCLIWGGAQIVRINDQNATDDEIELLDMVSELLDMVSELCTIY